MYEFPEFMRDPANAIDARAQSSGIEGYVFDGIDGSQMAFWTCQHDGISLEHVHAFDEYFVVVQGEYTLILGDQRIILGIGQEYYLPAGLPHAGEFTSGTRTIHAFGGKRAERARPNLG
ncbi:MAG: cupin domain-containing protein [Deltaproteobacteria bacterium]